MKYYSVKLSLSTRTTYQIQNWNLSQIETNIEISENENGMFKVIIPEDFESEGPKIIDKFREHKLPPSDTYIGEGELWKSAKITDFISGSNINESINASGFVMSNRVIKKLEDYNIGDYQVYNFPIIKKGVVHNNYSFLGFNSNGTPKIDFAKSQFYMYD